MTIKVDNSTHAVVEVKFFRKGHELGEILLRPFEWEKVEYDFDEIAITE